MLNVLGINDEILCRLFLWSSIFSVQVLDSQNKCLLQMHLVVSSICKVLCSPPGTFIASNTFSPYKTPPSQTRQVASFPLCRWENWGPQGPSDVQRSIGAKPGLLAWSQTSLSVTKVGGTVPIYIRRNRGCCGPPLGDWLCLEWVSAAWIIN